MIAVDATPLVIDPRRGVARALRGRLRGWALEPPARPLTLFAPHVLDLPWAFDVAVPPRPTSSARAFRRRLPRLLRAQGAEVLYSPFSAFPRTRIPTVVTVHELPFVRLGAAAEGRVRSRRHLRWLARNVAACAAIVVPSEATRDDLVRLHPEARSRVHVIPNAFDPTPWEHAARDAVRSTGRLVVAVGTGQGAGGAFKKGLDVLFDALRRLPDVHTVIVGRVRGRVPARVEVRPSLDDRALARLVASAHLLVHPARSEGFGYPPLEAMAAGTPVVTTDGGALPEVVGDAALVVAAGDAEALADGMRRVLDDRALARRFGEAGHERVRDPAFDPVAGARRLGALLERVGDRR